MHKIKVPNEKIRTDLISEQKNITPKRRSYPKENIIIEEINRRKNHTTTIYFEDITEQENYEIVQKYFIEEIKKYLNRIQKKKILIIGLGNPKSTPDSLGPKTIEKILVTSYLFKLGKKIENGYQNVSTFIPDVTGNTGIETSIILKSLIECTKVEIVIVIDALKTNSIVRLGKTIQITNQGISPGSGIGNKRKEISKRTMGLDVISIGIPTVIDMYNYVEEENLIVTPTNIDFLIEKLSTLIGEGLNISIHRDYLRQKAQKK